MISEDRLLVDARRQTLESYQQETKTNIPHCKWCESQGLSQDDEALFEMQFKRVVGAMRRNEDRVQPGYPSGHDQSGNTAAQTEKEHAQSRAQGQELFNHSSWAGWGALQSVLSLIVIAIIGIHFLGQKPIDASAYSKVDSSTYRTTTGSLKADVARGNTIWSAFGAQNCLPILFWHGDWKDELAILLGQYNHCNWLKVSGDTIATADGLVLFTSQAPELKVAKIMRTLRDKACKYYQVYGRYPDSLQDFGAGASYTNPVTGKKENPKIKQVINGSIVSACGGTQVGNGGGPQANRDNDRQPGAVWAVSVKSQPVIEADNNSYKWGSNCFYIYGNDRHGQFISGGTAGKDFIIALKNGKDITEVQRAALNNGDDKIGFFIGAKPNLNNIRWRYCFLFFSLFLLALATVTRCIHLRMSENR